MSSADSNFGGDGFKGLMARHVEKIVLSVSVVLAALFFCIGYSVESLPPDKSPAQLQSLVTEARGHIETDTWDIIKQDRIVPLNHPGLVKLNLVPTRGEDYPLPKVFKIPPKRPDEPRQDPKLYPPTKLEVDGLEGAVAFALKDNADDLWEDLPDARVKPDDEDDDPRFRRRKEEDEDSLFAGGIDQTRALSEAQIAEIDGYRPDGDALAKSRYVVAVKALVPFRKQTQEYDRVFLNAVGHNPERDKPDYIFFEVERAEVPADPNAELKWQLIANSTSQGRDAATWAGVAEEVADLSYLKPNVLTSPIPPLMFRPVDKLALHSEIPRRVVQDEPEYEEPAEGTDGEGELDPLRMGPTAGGGEDQPSTDEGRSVYGQSRRIPGMQSAFGEMEAGGEAEVSVDHKLVRFFDLSAQWGKSYRYRVRVYLRDPNNPTAGGESGESSDSSQKFGPLEPEMLDDAVRARIEKVKAEDEAFERSQGRPRQTYWRITDWSEPSPVIAVPGRPVRTLASSAEPGKKIILDREARIGFMSSEPEGRVLCVIWDESYAVDVPAERDVELGSLLNFRADADVVNPVTLEFKTIQDRPFRTNAIVLDIRGGEEMPGDKNNPLLAPGEYLIIDGRGNLVVRDELEDMEAYREYLFIEDKPSGKAGGEGGPAEMMFPGMGLGNES